NTAGTAKVRGSSYKTYFLWVGLWVEIITAVTSISSYLPRNLSWARVFRHSRASQSKFHPRRHKLVSGASVTGGGIMRVRYQRGYLRLGHRKRGPDCWEFLWWDSEPNGIRIRRKAVIGTMRQYPNVEDAWQASNGLRVSSNEPRNRQCEQAITVGDLVDHNNTTELANDLVDGGKSHATKTVY